MSDIKIDAEYPPPGELQCWTIRALRCGVCGVDAIVLKDHESEAVFRKRHEHRQYKITGIGTDERKITSEHNT